MSTYSLEVREDLSSALLKIVVAFTFLLISPAYTHAEAKELYQCPMHPQYTADHPGECPICGMRLVKVRNDSAHDHSGVSEAKTNQETLVGGSTNPIPGYAPVKIPGFQQTRIGLTTAKAKRIVMQREISTIGRVTYDETKVHHIHTKFEGYIEHIFVNYIGQYVQVGDPLFSVYSPDVLATINEYLIVLRSAGPSSVKSINSLAEAAKRKLSLWDISDEDIKAAATSGTAPSEVKVHSPVNGFVTSKSALQGMKIGPSDIAYDIADLSKVWIVADLYESDSLSVTPGTPGKVKTSYIPDKEWSTSVTYVSAVVDERTRTIKARLELDNPDTILKPGMFTNVSLSTPLGEGLVIPESAIINTGERKIAFVEIGPEYFEPREVITGVRTKDFYEVKRGVNEGESVVTSANFLLDSESRLRASILTSTITGSN